MRYLSICLFLYFLAYSLSAQQIQNVRFEQKVEMIHIYDDLIALSEQEKLQGNMMFEVRAARQGPGPVSGTFTDGRDGKTYRYVTIGNQVWMAENLAYLPTVNPPEEGSDSSAYYYVYGYYGTNVSAAKASDNYGTFGVLYNWTAAMGGSEGSSRNPSGVQGACPTGWHMPSDAEWNQLEIYLGMKQSDAEVAGVHGTNEGGKLKTTGTTQWIDPNAGATNESGFSALPGGYRYDDRRFDYVGVLGQWWSATEYNAVYAWSRSFHYKYSNILRLFDTKRHGFSVRCLRDK